MWNKITFHRIDAVPFSICPALVGTPAVFDGLSAVVIEYQDGSSTSKTDLLGLLQNIAL